MGERGAKMSCFNTCGCGLSRSQKIIIWGALITLVLNDVLSDDGKELIGNLMSSIGDLLITAQWSEEACSINSRDFRRF